MTDVRGAGRKEMKGTHQVTMLAYPDCQILDVTGPLEVFARTSRWLADRGQKHAGEAYRVEIVVDSNALYIAEDGIYTSAGVTAGMNLALAMVESDWSREVALAVARELVMYVKRAGGQAQFSRPLQAQLAESDRLRSLQLWMLEHLDGNLAVESLAARIAMSPRNFCRRFREELDKSPAHYVEEIRVEAARDRLETTRLPIGRIAVLCGFGSAETMRRAFTRCLGVAPTEYRRRFASPP